MIMITEEFIKMILMKRAKLVLILLISLHSFQTVASLPPMMMEHLNRHLSVCELYQLSRAGHLSTASSYYHLQHWSKNIIKEAMIAPLLKRQKINLRHSIHLQKEYASSFQTAKALTHVLNAMNAADIKYFAKEDFLDAIEQLYHTRKTIEGVAACVSIKWGNKYSDIHAWPLYSETFQTIKLLFESSETPPLTDDEIKRVQRFGLTKAEWSELQSLSAAGAVFEKQFEFLANDKGSWRGNLEQNAFVCTDESHTHYHFLSYLQELGFLKHFEVREGILAHRRPGFLQDHFGVMLFRKKDNRAFVYDSWHLDGGLPVIISGLEQWMTSQELENGIIPLESANKLLSAKNLLLKVVPDDRERPKGGSEDFHFTLRYRDL